MLLLTPFFFFFLEEETERLTCPRSYTISKWIKVVFELSPVRLQKLSFLTIIPLAAEIISSHLNRCCLHPAGLLWTRRWAAWAEGAEGGFRRPRRSGIGGGGNGEVGNEDREEEKMLPGVRALVLGSGRPSRSRDPGAWWVLAVPCRRAASVAR